MRKLWKNVDYRVSTIGRSAGWSIVLDHKLKYARTQPIGSRWSVGYQDGQKYKTSIVPAFERSGCLWVRDILRLHILFIFFRFSILETISKIIFDRIFHICRHNLNIPRAYTTWIENWLDAARESPTLVRYFRRGPPISHFSGSWKCQICPVTSRIRAVEILFLLAREPLAISWDKTR